MLQPIAEEDCFDLKQITTSQQDHRLDINNGFMDIALLVTHLGIRPLISGLLCGTKPRDGISPNTWVESENIFGGIRSISKKHTED